MRRVLVIGVVIILLVVIKNLLTSIYTLWNKQELVTQNKAQLEVEKRKNQELKAKLSYAQSQEFIEQQARDKLFLSKEGEQEVIIPPQVQEAATPKREAEVKDTRPNWKKWLDLFVY